MRLEVAPVAARRGPPSATRASATIPSARQVPFLPIRASATMFSRQAPLVPIHVSNSPTRASGAPPIRPSGTPYPDPRVSHCPPIRASGTPHPDPRVTARQLLFPFRVSGNRTRALATTRFSHYPPIPA